VLAFESEVNTLTRYVVLGAGGHAASIHDLLCNYSDYEIFFCAENFPSNFSSSFKRITLNAVLLNPDKYQVVLGIGQIEKRIELLETLCDRNLFFPSIIHPKAYVSSSSKIGTGSIVFANSYIGPNVTIGNYTIINTNSVVEHGSQIDNHSVVAPSVTIAGNVTIGRETFIGMSASISENLSIGDKCVIAANSFVNTSIKNGVSVFGTPARMKK
jgi:acetyltransferase EpsM